MLQLIFLTLPKVRIFARECLIEALILIFTSFSEHRGLRRRNHARRRNGGFLETRKSSEAKKLVQLQGRQGQTRRHGKPQEVYPGKSEQSLNFLIVF